MYKIADIMIANAPGDGLEMFSAMLFIFFCFFGLLGMLYFMLRQASAMHQQIRDELAQQRILLRALECRLEAMSPGGGEKKQAVSPDPLNDPLLSLSFDGPAMSSQGELLDIHFDPPEERAASR